MPTKAQLQQQLDETNKRINELDRDRDAAISQRDQALRDFKFTKIELDKANATIGANKQNFEVLRSLIESHLMAEHGVEVSHRHLLTTNSQV